MRDSRPWRRRPPGVSAASYFCSECWASAGSTASSAGGTVQLRALHRWNPDAVGAAMVPKHLAAYRVRRLLWQHDRLTRAPAYGNRDEDLSRETGRNDLRRHCDRQRAGIGVRLLERRTDPRLDPQL